MKLPAISSGDILRTNIQRGTLLGRAVEGAMLRGELVRDEVIQEMLLHRLEEEDCDSGFILDGIPRTIGQAKFIESYLVRKGASESAGIVVISIEVDDRTLGKRLSGRRVCPHCSSIFNNVSSPPRVDGICDFDGANLESRYDDRQEVLARRLESYRKTAAMLKEYYRLHYPVIEIMGDRGISDVTAEILVSVEAVLQSSRRKL